MESGDPRGREDAALIEESKKEVEDKLECWRKTLESKGFELNGTKTEYLRCDFEDTKPDAGEVLLDGKIVPRKESFHYLGSMIKSDEDIREDIRHRTQVGWAKWKLATGVPCDRKVPAKLKGSSTKRRSDL
ncbi:uncharacterized protein LOC113295211 [Papaver somniferum]|uniref:uncharacterized protein LOC113295211 n=1 Tax=Papaver somniferum TaxID=3469 RepID=UPI000E705A21|nr:uncharacterized protein LOC113295211 [Papaver somniferum]